MKRSLLTAVLAAALTTSMSSSASACLPYIPWLDPFAWMGFYGCGCGGCGPCCGGGIAPFQPAFAQPQVFSVPAAPAINSGGCNCTGSLPVQQTFSAAYPINSYQSIASYQSIPQYQPVPVASYQQPALSHQPIAQYAPTTTYPQYQAPAVAYGTPVTVPQAAPRTYTAPTAVAPGSTLIPPQPVGDVAGDHEYPAQSRLLPVPRAAAPQVPLVRPVSGQYYNYGMSPRTARTYPLSVR